MLNRATHLTYFNSLWIELDYLSNKIVKSGYKFLIYLINKLDLD